MPFDPNQAHITDKNGNVWQVLNDNGEYDDEATNAAYDNGKGEPTHPAPPKSK